MPDATAALKTTEAPHLPALDGLRGLAIILVIVAHCENALSLPAKPDVIVEVIQKVISYSTCGVDLFFVLSGFLITGILIRSKNSANYFRSFYARRALRIFPLYYLVLFLIFCGTQLFGEPPDHLMGTPADRIWLWFYGTNILMMLNRNWTYASLNHFWSLAVEEHFYLIWPLLVRVLQPRNITWVCIASLPISLLIRAGFVYLLHDPLSAYVLTICRLDALLMGCLIAVVAHLTDVNRLMKPTKIAAFVIGATLTTFIYFEPPLSNEARVFGPSIFALFFAVLLVLTLIQENFKKFFEISFLRELGKYSYGMYIFHSIIIGALQCIWNMSALPPVLSYCFFFAIVWSCTMLLAVVSYQTYEVRFLELKKYFKS